MCCRKQLALNCRGCIDTANEAYGGREQIRRSTNTANAVTAAEIPKDAWDLQVNVVIGGLEVFLGRTCELRHAALRSS
jgi:hypothetical protein